MLLIFFFFFQNIMGIAKRMFEKRGRLHSKGNDPLGPVSSAKIKRNYF